MSQYQSSERFATKLAIEVIKAGLIATVPMVFQAILMRFTPEPDHREEEDEHSRF